jgi:hypothetical protein
LSGQDVPGSATFDPITGPAAVVGARLTLTGHQFDLGSDAHGLTSIKSTWQVMFALERRPTTHVQWARASITGATYSFNHVTITGGTRVHIGWTAQGAAVAAANAAETPVDGRSQPGDCINPFQPVLLDSTGRGAAVAPPLAAGAGRLSTEDYVSGTLEYVVRPGRYRFVLLTPPGGHGFERDLFIP